MIRKILIALFFVVAAASAGTAVSLWKVQSEQAKKLDESNKQLLAFTAQKDSLTRSLGDATKFISDVYVQVSNISGEVAVSNTLEKIDNLNYKAQIASKLQTISSMVDGYKSQMNNAEHKIALLKQQNIALAGQMNVLEETVIKLKDIVQTQQQRIEELTKELETTRAERERYKAEAMKKAQQLVAKEKELEITTEELNTAYVIVGTIDELSEKGIIEKKGKVLFVGGSWQPVATLSDSSALLSHFKKINITKDLAIPLPFQSYKLISSHNSTYLQQVVGEKGVSPFALKISKPEKFWAQSKFLIIAEY